MSDDIPKPYLYIFLDEGGNFDFSPKGRVLQITSLSATRLVRVGCFALMSHATS